MSTLGIKKSPDGFKIFILSKVRRGWYINPVDLEIKGDFLYLAMRYFLSVKCL